MSWQVPKQWRAAVTAVPAPHFQGLPPRLAVLARAVPEGARVADIGADHGQLGAALLSAERAAHVHAVDLSEAALMGARATLATDVARGRASVHLGDGFAVLVPGTIDCAVLAGLGGRNTVHILARALDLGHRPQRVVVQALGGERDVRVALIAAGYGLVAEELTHESGRIFLTLTFELAGGVRALEDLCDECVGPLLAHATSPLLDAWLAVQEAWLAERVAALEAAQGAGLETARRRLAAVRAVQRGR